MADDDPKTEVLETAKREKVQFVQIMFMDLVGFVKTVTIPISKLERAFNEGVVFAGSSVVGYATIEESDMRADPVAETFRVFPWTSGDLKTAGIVCNIYDSKGNRFAGDPRYVLERVVKRARDMGYVPHPGPEYEFFLFKIGPDGRPTNIPSDNGRYFEQLPGDAGEVVRKQSAFYGNLMGFDVEATHHEVAPGQHEVNIRFDQVLESADRTVIFKHGAKEIAYLNGWGLTFMAKPDHRWTGSSGHLHMSVWDPATDRSLMHDDASPAPYHMSETMRRVMGGMMALSRQLAVFIAPNINSYKRSAALSCTRSACWKARCPAGPSRCGSRLSARFSAWLAPGIPAVRRRTWWRRTHCPGSCPQPAGLPGRTP